MDFYLDWNSDLALTPSGSIQTAVGWDQTRQRITRRLFSTPSRQLPDGSKSPPTCIFAPDFGVGLAQAVDNPTDAAQQLQMRRYISQGVLEDADVLSTSPPSVLFQQLDASTLRIIIGVMLLTGQVGQIALKASE